MHPIFLLGAIATIFVSAKMSAAEVTAEFKHAVSTLHKRLLNDRVYEPWSQNLRCLSFVNEGQTNQYVDIAIREVHTSECGGDQCAALFHGGGAPKGRGKR